jgi:hypothetical protein
MIKEQMGLIRVEARRHSMGLPGKSKLPLRLRLVLI